MSVLKSKNDCFRNNRLVLKSTLKYSIKSPNTSVSDLSITADIKHIALASTKELSQSYMSKRNDRVGSELQRHLERELFVAGNIARFIADLCVQMPSREDRVWQ